MALFLQQILSIIKGEFEVPEPKNLWIINQFSQSANQSGGIRHYVLCDELARKGHKVNLFCSNINNKTGVKTFESIGKQERFRQTRISVTSYAKRTKIAKSISFLVFFLKVLFIGIFTRPTPEIIIGSSPHLLSALAGEILAKVHKAKFYYEVRDVWPESASKIGELSEKSLIYFLFEKINNYLLANADVVITLFSSAEKYFLSKGVKPEKLRYLPNGCDFNLYPKSHDYIYSEREVSESISIAYIGAIGKPNAVQEIINIALALKASQWNMTFNIYGSGSERAPLEENLLGSRINNCFFHGLVEKTALQDIAEKTDFFIIVIPYFNGLYNLGFSMNKIFEYMALKRPVIFMMEKSLNSEPILNYGYQLIYGDTENIIRNLYKILSSSQEERRATAEFAYQYIRKNHDLRNGAECYL